MCLAIPGKIIDIIVSDDSSMASVDFAGIRKQVCMDWLPEAKPGDYVMVHVGFALSVVDEAEALGTLSMLREMGEISDPPPADTAEDAQ